MKEVESQEDIMEILKKTRKELKVTQSELAEFANISKTSIGEIERCEVDVRLSNLLKILKLCGITLYCKDPRE